MSFLESPLLSVVTAVLACVASWVVLKPFFSSPKRESSVDTGTLVEAYTRKEFLFGQLEELEQDRASGRVDDGVYEASKAELSSSAAACLEEIDRLKQSHAAS